MAAAVVTEIQKKLSPTMGIEFVRCYLTTSGDWYYSKLGTVRGVAVTGDTYQPTAVTISGQKVTFTCTALTYLNVIIWGDA